MREPKWLIWLLVALIPICQPQEQSIQAQLNLLTKRTASLENEVKTLKDEVKTLKVKIFDLISSSHINVYGHLEFFAMLIFWNRIEFRENL